MQVDGHKTLVLLGVHGVRLVVVVLVVEGRAARSGSVSCKSKVACEDESCCL